MNDNSSAVAQVPSEERPLFRELDPCDVTDLETSEIESLCMSCGESGTTRMLLTKIPMFREVIVISFYCPHCQTSNNEIQPGAALQDKGVRYTLKVQDTVYLSRLVVKADSACVRIPELEFEIPPSTQKGSITTVESIITQSLEGLEQDQPVRKALQPELASKLDDFISKLKECLEVKHPFTLVVDDPSGNSFVENKFAPDPDPHLSIEYFERTEEQNRQLGLNEMPSATEGEVSSDQLTSEATAATTNSDELEQGERAQDEVMTFHVNCSNCLSPTETRMKLVDIPHFKQVIVMATTCDHCGHRSNEVKSGTGISKHGTRITLKLTHPSDLSRDILKAETAAIAIPELEFEMHSGTLGGRFTTIEGLLEQVKNQLSQRNPLLMGDSTTESKLSSFLDRLTEVKEGKQLDVHVVLDDPAGNSYIQNVYAPELDPEMTVEHYERTFEHNELLGLNDMKTENYRLPVQMQSWLDVMVYYGTS